MLEFRFFGEPEAWHNGGLVRAHIRPRCFSLLAYLVHHRKHRLDRSVVAAALWPDERGVAHTFFDESRLRELLARHFEIESLTEHDVDEIAGSWAHQHRPLNRAVHWFAIATKR